MVAPWQRVFDAGSWAALLNRHVLPKLAHVLSLLVVNPAAQERVHEEVSGGRHVSLRRVHVPYGVNSSWLAHGPLRRSGIMSQ